MTRSNSTTVWGGKGRGWGRGREGGRYELQTLQNLARDPAKYDVIILKGKEREEGREEGGKGKEREEGGGRKRGRKRGRRG